MLYLCNVLPWASHAESLISAAVSIIIEETILRLACMGKNSFVAESRLILMTAKERETTRKR